MPFTPATPVAPFYGFTDYTPALPEFYWNVYSAEQRIKHICYELHKIVAYANMLGENINLDHNLIAELQTQMQRFLDGEMLDFYEAQINAWIESNMERIICKAVKHVYFGLTSDGYFCAYIPDSWADITFDTGAVFGRSDYGRLILKMNTDSPNAIDNTYSYSLNSSPNAFETLIRDLEINSNRTDATYEALFTNMNVEISNGNF